MKKLFRYHNSRMYISSSFLCAFYLLLLFVRALLQHIDIALYNIPVLGITLYSIHKMAQKKLPRKIAIEFKERVYWINFIFIVYLINFIFVLTTIICFSLVKNQYTFDYSHVNFWKNISYTAEYNNFFFFTYNILCSSVLTGLLTFNNINNVKKFYHRKILEGYAPMYINSLMYILIYVIYRIIFGQLKQISTSYFYFFAITYLSGFICSLISTMIISVWLFIRNTWLCSRKIIIRLFNMISLFFERIKK